MSKREANARWREKNLEKVAATNAAYNAANREAIALWHAQPENREKAKIRSREWDRAHPERRRQANKAHLRRNPGRNTPYSKAHKLQKIRAKPAWANDFFISEAYALARLRTRLTGIEWQVDHIVPLNSSIVCGLHCEANLRVITKTENCRKQNRVEEPLLVGHQRSFAAAEVGE